MENSSMKIFRCAVLLLAAFLLVPGLALAHSHGEKGEKKEMEGEMDGEMKHEMDGEMKHEMDGEMKHEMMEGEMEMHGFHKDLMANFDDAATKLMSLAEAIPADKYDWRPAEGVRSVSETLMHVAGANYFFGSQFGAEMPENVRELEKITDKDEVVKTLKASFEAAKKAMGSTMDADLDKVHELPFGKFSSRSMLLLMATHAHEHLGQTIAYARSNGVVPPWSQ